MRIQHNIPAMSAYRNYSNNVSSVAKNLERLSSGYRINRAGDDAAGLAISEKMRAQISGLEQAQSNAKSGINLVQTAEGALTEVHDMLNRMVTLAEQSANGTYDDDVDRVQLQKEVNQLRSEINRIADSANFNGINLLDGSRATSSANPLASATPTSKVDGMAATAGGKAQISFELDTASMSTDSKPSVTGMQDGKAVTSGVKAEFTLSMGGFTTDDDFSDIATVLDSANVAADGTSLTNLDLTKFTQAGDKISFKIGGKSYTYEFGQTVNSVAINSVATLKQALEKDGFSLTDTSAATDNSECTIGKANAKLTGFSGTTTEIEAGVTKVSDLAALQLDNTAAPAKIGDRYDIVVTGADGSTKSDGDLIQNGDTIKLTAKYGGAKITADDTLFTTTVQSSLKDATDAANIKGTGVATNDGLDEGGIAPSAAGTTVYKLDFDFDKLNAGQSFSIGGKTFEFKNTATTDADPNYYIDISAVKDADGDDGIWNEMADAIGNKLVDAGIFKKADNSAAFTFTAAKTQGATGDKKWTIELKTTSGAKAAEVNLGQVRPNTSADNDGLLTSTYTQIADAAAGGVAPTTGSDPYASVTYTYNNGTGFAVGDKITIKGKDADGKDKNFTVNFVNTTGGATTGKQDDGTYNLAVGDASNNAKLQAAFEEIGYSSGLLTFNTTAKTITIKGTTLNQKGSDLVTELDNPITITKANPTPPSVTFEGASTAITADSTTVKQLKDMEITVDGKTFRLADAFDVQIGSGTGVSDETKIGVGAKIKLTARTDARLDQKVLDALALKVNNGKVSAKNYTVENGWDEGSSAAGDKTHYALTLDLTKAAGGTSFTFGNEGGKSFTFDITYDSETTGNNSIGDKKDDVAGNPSSARVAINLFGLDYNKALEKIKGIVAEQMGEDYDVKASLSSGKVSLTVDANKDGAEYNLGNIRYSSTAGAISGTEYDPAGGAADSHEGIHAQLTYGFDVSKLKAGDALTVGSTTVYFGDDPTKIENISDGAGNTTTKITLNVKDAIADPTKITSAFESSGFKAGEIKFDTTAKTMTITDAEEAGRTAEDFMKGIGNGAEKGIVSLYNADRKADDVSGGLILQIGDTADSFNQLRVSIADCHADALGIGKIDIGTQAGAADAMTKIKAAINYVSDVRGDLGATQNRLDHTINNLSVMQENIQDAESTIRDVDVAKEMMEYTKNNILVQSAQAMLAQANQLPQGVLQLLG